MAISIYLVWATLVTALTVLSMWSDPEAPTSVGIERTLAGLGIVLAFMSLTAWLLAIRLLPTDAGLSPRGRQVWWVLLIILNLFSGPAYLLSRFSRQFRSDGIQVPR